MIRCSWCGDDPLYVAYHDNEWGKPVTDDRVWFEFLLLEGAQAGLSWITILRKREAYRAAFDGFDPAKIAQYDSEKIAQLIENKGIVRNKLKINSAIKNARAFLAIQTESGSFNTYIWSFMPQQKPLINQYKSEEDIPAQTELSQKISTDLKRRGMTFVGPTIIYAFMQATGIVNDHIEGCSAR